MKREFIGMLFIVITTLLIIMADYVFGVDIEEYLSKFIIIWLLIAFYVGQYSMKFPKAF